MDGASEATPGAEQAQTAGGSEGARERELTDRLLGRSRERAREVPDGQTLGMGRAERPFTLWAVRRAEYAPDPPEREIVEWPRVRIALLLPRPLAEARERRAEIRRLVREPRPEERGVLTPLQSQGL